MSTALLLCNSSLQLMKMLNNSSEYHNSWRCTILNVPFSALHVGSEKCRTVVINPLTNGSMHLKNASRSSFCNTKISHSVWISGRDVSTHIHLVQRLISAALYSRRSRSSVSLVSLRASGSSFLVIRKTSTPNPGIDTNCKSPPEYRSHRNNHRENRSPKYRA